MEIILHPSTSSLKKSAHRISAYRIVDQQIDKLAEAQKYSQALAMLQSIKIKFPTRLADIYNYRLWLFDQLNQPAKKMSELLEAADKNIFFPLDKHYRDGITQLPEFQNLSELSQQELARLNQNSQPKLEIYMPNNRPIHSVLLILHGDGQTNESICELWPPTPYLNKGFAVAYLQSPSVFCSNGFHWTDNYPAGREAIQQALHQIQSKLGIKQSQVILAGYSGGAMASISAITHGVVRPKQCIAFMPHNGGYVGNMVCSELKTVIFKAEFDQNIDTLLHTLHSLLPVKTIKLMGLDHSLPDDMASHVLAELEIT